MNSQKGFVNVILVVAIIVLVGVVGYFAFVKKSEPIAQQTTPPPTTTQNQASQQQTSTPENETANLKTYTNPQYGFSFQYPSTVSITFVDHVPPHGTDLILPCDGSKGTYAYSSCGISIEKDGAVGNNILNFFVFPKPMINLEAYARNYPNGEYIKTKIDGIDAYQLHGGNGLTRVHVQDSKHGFLFFYSDSNAQVAKAILGTLQFTQ